MDGFSERELFAMKSRNIMLVIRFNMKLLRKGNVNRAIVHVSPT